MRLVIMVYFWSIGAYNFLIACIILFLLDIIISTPSLMSFFIEKGIIRPYVAYKIQKEKRKRLTNR